METRAHYVLIGAFVLSAVALGFLFVLWLGQAQREFDEYDVIFTERVSGLSEGAAVRFNGIQKGEVAELRIDPDDPKIVIARVRVDKDTPIKTDTRAELELVGFTGLAIIQFVGGSKDAPLLKDVERGVPRINADASGFAAFLEGSGDIVESVNRLLSQENTEVFARILENVDRLTGSLAEQDENIATTLENAAVVSAELAEAAADLNRLTNSLNKLAEDDATEALAETRETMQSLQALIDEMNLLVSENREPISQFTEQGLAQVGPAVIEARRLMRTLDRTLNELNRDPRGYLFGEPAPEYQAGE